MHRIKGVIVDVPGRRMFPGELVIDDGRILSVEEGGDASGPFILPGLIDAHVHVESSMLVPSEFARMAVVHGTVGSVSDPHEIANVCGREGLTFMLRNGGQVPFKFSFGAPSCVPATDFESSGARLGASDLAEVFRDHDLAYLSEMMNFPGVVYGDGEVAAKLELARSLGKPIDGHAPGLRGSDLEAYVAAGISTDHECFNIGEARDKLRLGMKIQVREGSAARNFDELIPLLDEAPDMLMLCSDDKHPDDLLKGHINQLVARAVRAGYDIFDVLGTCTQVPKDHYGLNNGLLRPGDPADIIEVGDLEKMDVLATWIDGRKVAANGECLIDPVPIDPVNVFEAGPISEEDIRIPALTSHCRVIEAIDGQLITGEAIEEARIVDGFAVSDPGRDILKLVVYNRYQAGRPALAFIRKLGLKDAAIASTVAHDSHNIIATGTDDELITRAVNLIVANKGGICIVTPASEEILPLPVGGIMSVLDGRKVAELYTRIDAKVKESGSKLRAPFMTLSFMALLVIPDLKLSDKGLFSGKEFAFKDLFVQV